MHPLLTEVDAYVSMRCGGMLKTRLELTWTIRGPPPGLLAECWRRGDSHAFERGSE